MSGVRSCDVIMSGGEGAELVRSATVVYIDKLFYVNYARQQ